MTDPSLAPGARLMAWMLPHVLSGTDGHIHRLCRTNIELQFDPSDADGDHVDINSLVALIQGQGDGTQALRLIIGMADIFGVTLHVFARALDDKPHTTRRLIGWYERHGFIVGTNWRPDDADPDEVDESHHGLDLYRPPATRQNAIAA